MTPPYYARIMARLAGSEPIEFVRFKRRILPHDLHLWTSELGAQWEWWIEQPLRDKQCISSRPKPAFKCQGTRPSRRIAA